MPTLAFRMNDKKLNVTFKPYMCERLSLVELDVLDRHCSGTVLLSEGDR